MILCTGARDIDRLRLCSDCQQEDGDEGEQKFLHGSEFDFVVNR